MLLLFVFRDTLVGSLVCELYNLTPDEIKIVEGEK